MIALSILGTGNYQEVTYRDENLNKQYKSKFFTEVVSNIYYPEKIFVVLTIEAKDKHYSELSSKLELEPIYIPTGRTTNEIWDMFSIIAEKIPEDSELLIDITHGFRHQPMLILSMAVFLRVVKNVTIKKIIYGAYDARNEGGIAPIFDLTPFIDLIDWSYGTELFIKNGLSSLLSKLLKDLHDKTRIENRIYSKLKTLGSDFQSITESLTFIRPEEVSKKSVKLRNTISEINTDLEKLKATEPLKYLLEKIPASLNNLILSEDENIFSDAGFRMQAEMIKYYIETQQFVQAITLCREVLVSFVCKTYSFKFQKRDDRIKAEERLNEWSDFLTKGVLLDGLATQMGKLWGKIREARNDINHAGMRESVSSASKLKKNIEEYCNETIEMIINAHQPIQSSE